MSEISECPQPEPTQPAAGEATLLAAAVAFVAAVAVVLLRLPGLSRLPLTWDGVQYVLGVLHYDLAMHEPHPPGYFLYVMTARALHLLGIDAHLALLTAGLAACAITTWMIVFWVGRMGGQWAAAGAAVLCVFSPMCWMVAIDPNTYAFAGMLSAVVGYLSWRAWREGGWWPALSGAALGLAAGYRPTTALFLAPLWVWCVFSGGPRRGVTGLAALVVATAAWVLPFLSTVGGLTQYMEISGRLGGGMMQFAPLSGNFAQLGVHLMFLLTGAVSVLMLGWLFVPRASGTEFARSRPFLALWLLPALAFFVLVHTAHPHYVMVLAPVALIAGGLGLGRALAAQTDRWRRVALLALIVVVNGAFTWANVVRPQMATQAHLLEIQEACLPYASPGTVALTSIASASSPAPRGEWVAFRAAMYLWPEMIVCIFPLERPAEPGLMPNAGHGIKSAALVPPAVLNGTTTLLLLGEGMVDYLPKGVEAELVVAADATRIYAVQLDPARPLVLQAGGRIWLAPRNGEGAQ